MTDSADNQASMPKLKTIVTLILVTASVVSAIWGFFLYRMLQLKDERIAILETSSPQTLQGIEEKLDSLQKQILPFSFAFPFDDFDGRIGLGTGSGPTKINILLDEAGDFRRDRKFDLASAKVAEIDRIYPNCAGATYMRFLIERDKGNEKECLQFAEQVIEQLPSDKRILEAYEFAVKGNLKLGNKKKAEGLCLSAIKIDPQNQPLRNLFKNAFGYEPSIPRKDE